MRNPTPSNKKQYTTPEFLYRGEIGRVNGCRFVESTLAPTIRGCANALAVSAATGASAIGYGTTIFGKGFYGATELDGGVHTFTVTGPTKDDPLAQVDTYGWKMSFTAAVLDTSAGLVLWTGSGDRVLASATSAAVAQGVSVGGNVWSDASGMESRVVLAT